MRVWLTLILLLPLVAVACRDFEDRTGSSGLANGPKVVMAGTWEGQWSTLVGSGDAGKVTFVIEQDEDNNLFGCSCWTGSACWDDGRFSGLIKGSSLLPIVLEVLRDPQGTVPRLGLTRVTSRLDVIGDLLTGTIEVRNDDARRCSDNIARRGDEGTLQVTRTDVRNLDLFDLDVEGLDGLDLCDQLALRMTCSEIDP